MEAQGKEVSALDEKPVLNAMELFYCNAFNFLSIGRHSSMGAGAIPLADCISFYDIYMGPHSLRDFTKIMRSVDVEYLREQRKD